jgi:PTH1 family peptidyl-tRNA hydrolase
VTLEQTQEEPSDWLLFGLGNPGASYRETRHNLGWMLVDRLCARHATRLLPGRADYFAARVRVDGRTLHLIKPTTYMNLSGRAVRAYLAIEKPARPELCAAVDEVALELGKLRLRPKGSSGGHNGLKSIEASLHSREFARVRMGCGPQPAGVELEDFVLGEFSRPELELARAMLDRAADAVESWVLHGMHSTMSRFNG